jgi:hypothetical protein
VKVTVTVPIIRDGESRELALTRDEDGNVEVFVEPGVRTARAAFTVDAQELLAAARELARPAAIEEDRMEPPPTIPASFINGQTSVEDFLDPETGYINGGGS